MKLKFKLKKADFEALDEAQQSFYKASGDGYQLDIEDLPDTGKLERALAREREDNVSLREETKNLQTQVDDFEKSKSKPAKDIDKLTRDHNRAIEELQDTHKQELEAVTGKAEKLSNHIRTNLVDNYAMQMASDLSDSPKLLVPHIKARLLANLDGDEPSTQILGADGKPSKMTKEELQKEFVANPDFKSIIRASKASGGGADRKLSNSNANGGAGSGGNSEGEKPLQRMPLSDLTERMKQTVNANREANKV